MTEQVPSAIIFRRCRQSIDRSPAVRGEADRCEDAHARVRTGPKLCRKVGRYARLASCSWCSAPSDMGPLRGSLGLRWGRPRPRKSGVAAILNFCPPRARKPQISKRSRASTLLAVLSPLSQERAVGQGRPSLHKDKALEAQRLLEI